MTTPTTDRQTHPCASVLCDDIIDVDKLACRRHWFALPSHIRKRVSTLWYRHRRDPDNNDLWRAYIDARAEAVEYLNHGL